MKKIPILLSCLGLSARLLAAPNYNAADYLYMGMGARAIGMGGAFVSVADDVTAEYWNPAGLTRMGAVGTEVGSMYSLLSLGRSLNYLSFYQHAEGVGDFAAGITQYGVSGIQGMDAAGNATGDVVAQEGRVSISYASYINYQLRWGLTIKGLAQQLDTSKAFGYSVDIGMVANPNLGTDLALGLNIQNIVSNLSWDTGTQDLVAPNLKLGVSDRFFEWHWLVSVDLDLPIGVAGLAQPHLGTEYWIDHAWALRAGYTNGDFSAGIGWNYLFYEFDYAYTLDSLLGTGLGDRQQISMLLKW